MEEFDFCMEIIKREGEKFNVGINTTTASQITAATAVNVNYDIAHNRCSYLYRCGTITLSFAKECFRNFFSDYKSFVFLLSKWIINPDLTVCSLSKGPALDYIAFLLSYQSCGNFPYIFKNVKVISRYGAWRNTVNIMHQIVTEGYLKSLQTPVMIGNIEVVQGDPFVDFTQKVSDPISNSDVIIMMKTLNLQADYDQNKATKSIQEFLAALKPDAVLFCIDTKPSIALITKEISSFPGTYLLHPTFENTSIIVEHADLYKEIFGCFPVVSARGSFFVWHKSSIALPSSKLSNLMDEVSESVKRLLRVNSDDNSCDKISEHSTDNKKVITSSSQVSKPSCFPGNCDRSFALNGNVKSVAMASVSHNQVVTDTSIANIPSQNSKTSRQNSLNHRVIEENVGNSLIYNDKSIQTEPENTIKSDESAKIAALTDRVANLTTMLIDLIETNELRNSDADSLNEDPAEGMCGDSISDNCLPRYCSLNSSLHKCHCEVVKNCTNVQIASKPFENCQSYSSAHKQGCLACSHHSSCVSLDHVPYQNCPTPHNDRESLGEKNSLPKLVIPLNNIPTDVVTQIISLITQSNKNF